ncbi:MAG: hypothetical protein L6R28_06345 [Planctomycetes bacterium]|nr:hypothetical protein [Planctomycetota bacterium]
MRYAIVLLAASLLSSGYVHAADERAKDAAPAVEMLEPAFSAPGGKARMTFKVKASGGVLLGTEILKLSVTKWTDDKGTDLGTKDASAFYGNVTCMTSGSGNETEVTLAAKTGPATGAATMTLEGALPFTLGLDLQEGQAKDVKIEQGASFKVGPYDFKVVKIEPTKDMLGGAITEGQRVTFSFDSPVQLRSFDFLKTFTFATADCKAHPSALKNFVGSSSKGGEHTLSVALLPSEAPLTVNWAVYGKMETCTLALTHSGPFAPIAQPGGK